MLARVVLEARGLWKLLHPLCPVGPSGCAAVARNGAQKWPSPLGNNLAV